VNVIEIDERVVQLDHVAIRRTPAAGGIVFITEEETYMGSESGYQRLIKGIAVSGLTAVLVGTTISGVLAFDGEYGKGSKVGGGDYKASTYAVTADDTLYQYATGTDGSAYYTTYDGEKWAEWSAWESQPSKYTYDPAPVVYADETYVTYRGEDEKYYLSVGGGEWTDISGKWTFKYAPYANVYGEKLYIYGVGNDGYVYWKHYDGAEWSKWAEIGEQTTSAYEVYAVDWNGYDNVFWTSEDGSVYWNRWDGSEWSGTKALSGDYKVQYAPYAVGYAPEKKLYAYAVTEDGAPAWNVFTEGEGWSDWKPYEGLATKVKNQPNAYVYEDVQHLVFTGADDHAYYTEYDGAWSDEWADLGDNYAWDPYQYEYDGGLYLTYTGKNGSVYVKEYEAAGDGY